MVFQNDVNDYSLRYLINRSSDNAEISWYV